MKEIVWEKQNQKNNQKSIIQIQEPTFVLNEEFVVLQLRFVEVKTSSQVILEIISFLFFF